MVLTILFILVFLIILFRLIDLMVINPHRYSELTKKQYQPINKSLSKIIDAELKELSQGEILFNPPNEMKVGIRERIEARLSRTLNEDLTKGFKGGEVAQIEKIQIGPLMKVSLTGNSFEIKTISHEEQVVSTEGYTQWSWDVTPIESGIQILTLVATVRIMIPNQEEEKKDCPILERQIQVRSNPWYSTMRFITRNWQWIVSTIIGSGLIGYLLKREKFKTKRKK